MTQDSSGPSSFADADDQRTVVGYRRHSGLALAAAALSAVSAVAFATWMLWWVPLTAIFVSLLALYSLRCDPGQKGRRVTVVALTVALVIAAAAPTRFFTRGGRISEQAELAGVEWLEILRRSQDDNGQPDTFNLAKAHQLRLPTEKRQRFDGSLTKFYLDDDTRRASLEQFANETLVHTLYSLGPRATIWPYAVESCRQDADVDYVTSVCVVTFLREGRAESFFVQLNLERTKDADSATGKWRVAGYRGHAPANIVPN